MMNDGVQKSKTCWGDEERVYEARKMRKSLHCINDGSLLIHWLQINCHDPPEPWVKKCDVHDQPEHSTHRTVLLKRLGYWNKFLTLWPFSQGTNLLILALESTYELLYMHQLPCFQISAPSPEPAAHMMQTPPHSRTQLSKRMAARGKRTLITPPHRRAAPWCAPELGAKNRTGKLKINYSGTGMEGGSWLSGGHWGQRRGKREDAEQAGKEGRRGECRGERESTGVLAQIHS